MCLYVGLYIKYEDVHLNSIDSCYFWQCAIKCTQIFTAFRCFFNLLISLGAFPFVWRILVSISCRGIRSNKALIFLVSNITILSSFPVRNFFHGHWRAPYRYSLGLHPELGVDIEADDVTGPGGGGQAYSHRRKLSGASGLEGLLGWSKGRWLGILCYSWPLNYSPFY